MQIRGHGNGLAIALAGLAVVIAGSGTAYAVTATVVNIADPTTPSRVARVDAAGRLSTSDPASTINLAAVKQVSANIAEIYSAPTTATLAVTKFSAAPITGIAGPYAVYLFQVPTNPDGSCATTTTIRPLGYAVLSPGQTAAQDFASPIQVAPTAAGTKYCLNLYATPISGSAPNSEFLALQVTAYAVTGRYTGVGAAGADAPPAAPQQKTAVVKRR